MSNNIGEIMNREQIHLLINTYGYRIGVELGTQRGYFADYLLKNTELYLYMIDIWKQQSVEDYFDIANVPDELQVENLQETMKIVAKYPGRCSIIRKLSAEAATDFMDDSIDFVYIDANHNYKSTLADLMAWFPKIKVNGLVAGHDYLDSPNNCGSEFGVASALRDFMIDKPFTLRKIAETWPGWWFLKTSEGK